MHNQTLAQVARRLGTGRNRLISQLKAMGVIDHQRLPAQRYIDAGYFTVELRQHTRNPSWNNGRGQLYSMALVTPAGVRWLSQRLGISVRDMDQPANAASQLSIAEGAIRLLRMHIQTPTAVDSATALAVAEEALHLLEQHRQRSAA